MRPTELIEVYVEVPVTGQAGALSWVNFTEGLINTNIVRGVNNYQGPWAQPDTGQLVLTTRNNQLDPEFNNQIRNKRRIKVVKNHSNTQETIFIGRIGNIDVRYQPRNSAPIITINAFDIIADLNKSTVTQADSDAFFTYPPTNVDGQKLPACSYLLEYMQANSIISQLELGSLQTEYLKNSIGNNPQNAIQLYNRIEYGKTYYEALAEHARGNNGFFFAARDGALNYRWRTKPTSITPKIYFDSRDDVGTPYIDLTLVDGYDRIYNDLTIKAYDIGAGITQPASKEYYETIPGSITIWGEQPIVVASVTSTLKTVQEQEAYNGWLFESGFPHREISEITWKGTNDPVKAATTDIGHFIDIYYEYGEYVIDRQYQIVGVRHEINANEWFITYQLRNWDFKIAATTIPIISSNRTNTDNTTPVQFTLDNYGEFFAQTWNFGDGTTSTAINPSKTYTTPGTYNVTCTGTNDFGQNGTSTPIVITVSLALPTITNTFPGTSRNPRLITYANYGGPSAPVIFPAWVPYQYGPSLKGQFWMYAQAIQNETSITSGFPTLAVPDLRQGTNDVYPMGPFQITQRPGDTPNSLNQVSRLGRLTATNVTGSASIEETYDGYWLSDKDLSNRSARYIMVRRQTSQDTVAYSGSNTFDDITPIARIKNIKVLDANGNNLALNKPVVTLLNNNGFAQSSTLSGGEFSTWNIATEPYLITDENSSTFARFTTNLGPYSVGYPRGAGWLCQPDYYFIIDLGAVMTFRQINIEFANEEGFPRKEYTKYSLPGAGVGTGFRIFYNTVYPPYESGSGSTFYGEYKGLPSPYTAFGSSTQQGHFFPADTALAVKIQG
jgi:PKD repeat protein